MNDEMKAYAIGDPDEGMLIIFAPSRGQAKSVGVCTSECGDLEYLEIYCRREPRADKFYQEMSDKSNRKNKLTPFAIYWRENFEFYRSIGWEQYE